MRRLSPQSLHMHIFALQMDFAWWALMSWVLWDKTLPENISMMWKHILSLTRPDADSRPFWILYLHQSRSLEHRRNRSERSGALLVKCTNHTVRQDYSGFSTELILSNDQGEDNIVFLWLKKKKANWFQWKLFLGEWASLVFSLLLSSSSLNRHNLDKEKASFLK